MNWHNHTTHAALREIQEARLTSREVMQRKEWHEGRGRRRLTGPRRLAGWAGHGLVRAGERLRAWSAAEPSAEPAEA